MVLFWTTKSCESSQFEVGSGYLMILGLWVVKWLVLCKPHCEISLDDSGILMSFLTLQMSYIYILHFILPCMIACFVDAKSAKFAFL